MVYEGQELTPITKSQIFDPPKEMLVWEEEDDIPCMKFVWAIAPKSAKRNLPVYCMGGSRFKYCSEIPEKPKSRRATNRELSKWIINHGELTYDLNAVYHEFSYMESDREKPVENEIFIRKWEDTEWHEPTVDYMYGKI